MSFIEKLVRTMNSHTNIVLFLCVAIARKICLRETQFIHNLFSQIELSFGLIELHNKVDSRE